MKSVKPRMEILESRVAPATFTVTTLADSGAGSLRDTLAKADASPGSDTIRFKLPAPPAHGENVILLTSGELTSKGNVTITGPGRGKLIVDANNASRVFDINDGSATTDSPATISGLSIIRGAAGGSDGGGVFSTESLTLNNVVISKCSATYGGGVGVNDSSGPPETVTISNSFVTDNSASNAGGGIDVFGLKEISIKKTVVTGNTSAFLAGGIYARIRSTGTGIAITGSTISSNSAAVAGGGVWLVNSATSAKAKSTISGSVFAYNSSTGAGGGGIVIFRSGSAAITGSTIRNNSAVYYGGGVSDIYGAALTISNCTIAGNRTTPNAAGQGGGGIFVKGTGGATPTPVTINGSSIIDNSSALDGGGLLAKNGIALSISGTTFAGNRAANNGGAVNTSGTAANKVDLTINGGNLSNNFASVNGGAVYATGDGQIFMTATKVTGNQAVGAGGGLCLTSSAASNGVVLNNLSVSSNVAGELSIGGGVCILSTPDFHITGGSFTNNKSGAGAIGLASSSSGSILGVNVTGNFAVFDGGGIDNGGGTVVVQAAKVFGNTAPTDPDFIGTFTFV
jgi:predicted outer membrane repeat protein